MTKRAVVTGQSGLADHVAVAAARTLYRHVLPRTRFRGAQRLGRVPFLAQRRAIVQRDGVSLLIPAFDGYWAPYFYRGVPYEPEVGEALRLLGAVGPAAFLDCGANYGYWSCRVAAGEFGEHSVVAVEASESTYRLLKQNLGNDARVLLAAVTDHVGTVQFDEDFPHAGRRISGTGRVTVEATTIDDLAGDASRVLIKLDVEGAEPAAMDGAEKTLSRADVALLYEDHGSDSSCSSTAAMLDCGLRIYDVQEGRAPESLTSIADVVARKDDLERGYNYVAVSRGGAYEQALESARR